MTDFDQLGDSEKVRLTLFLDPKVKEELKRQAAELGVSVSAYVSVMVGMKKTD